MRTEFSKEESRICPICGAAYATAPALSRKTNEPICPDCGTREALASIGGISAAEQELILAIVHKHGEERLCFAQVRYAGRSETLRNAAENARVSSAEPFRAQKVL